MIERSLFQLCSSLSYGECSILIILNYLTLSPIDWIYCLGLTNPSSTLVKSLHSSNLLEFNLKYPSSLFIPCHFGSCHAGYSYMHDFSPVVLQLQSSKHFYRTHLARMPSCT